MRYLKPLFLIALVGGALVGLVPFAKNQEAEKAPSPPHQIPAAPEPAQPEKIDRLDLLELRDLTAQAENIRLQTAIFERRLKDIDAETKARMDRIGQKYKVGKDDRLNIVTGEIIRTRPPGEKAP